MSKRHQRKRNAANVCPHRRCLRVEQLEDRRMLAALTCGSADFDSDGDVDGRDFLTWQRGYGTTAAAKTDGNADLNADVDGDDLAIWEHQYGTTTDAEPFVGFTTFATTSGPQLVLEIVGSSSSDTIRLNEDQQTGDIRITIQNPLGADVDLTVTTQQILNTLVPTGLSFRGVYAKGLAGNDTLDALLYTFPSILDGGDGNDDIDGRGGNDLLLGGDGDDTIHAHGGRDILIGGLGADVIEGGADRDVLIAGVLRREIELATLDEALQLWAAETGPPAHAAELIALGLVANQTVLDDQAVDQVNGGVNTSDAASRDLFYATFGTPAFNDSVVDSAAENEQMELTHPPIAASELVSQPFEVGLDGGGAIISFRFGVAPSLFNGSTPQAVTIHVLLLEGQEDGTIVELANFQVLLSEVTLLGLDGPNGLAVVEVNIDAAPLRSTSTLEATTTLRGPNVLDGLPESLSASAVVETVRS